MTARGSVPCFVLASLLALDARASEDPGLGQPGAATLETRGASEGAPGLAAVTTTATARGPLLHPALSKRVAATVNDALPVALERVRGYPSCQALFERFGADGVEKLNGTSYYPADRKQERKFCRGSCRVSRGASSTRCGTSHAATQVRGSHVVLCRSFGRLSTREAAILLIHEALHFAGQTEFPVDPSAPDAVGITKMVMKGCRLR